MAEGQDDLVVQIRAQIDSLVSGMSEAASSVSAAVSEMTEHFEGLKDIAGEVLGAFVGYEGIKHMTEAMIELGSANAQLGSAFKATGAAVGYTLPQLEAFAEKLSGVTTSSTVAVKQAEALLLTFTRVRNEAFERTLVAAGNLAARLGTDLVSATSMLGRALQDPEAGMMRLQRAGVILSATQKELIRDFVAAGESGKAQEIILGEVERRFNGAAAAASNTLGGALAQLKNKFNELFEGTQDAANPAIAAIKELTATLANPEVKRAMDEMISGLAKIIGMLAETSAGLVLLFKGPTDPLLRLDDQIRQLDARIKLLNSQAPSFAVGSPGQLAIAKELNQLIAQRTELLRKEEVMTGMGARATDEEKKKYGITDKPKDSDKPVDTGPTPEELEERYRARLRMAINTEQQELALTRSGSTEKIQIATELANNIGKLYGKNSTEYQGALKAQLQASVEYGEQQRAIAMDAAKNQRDVVMIDLDSKMQALQAQLDNNAITYAEFYRQEQELANQKLQVNIDYYDKLKDLQAENALAVQKANSEIARAQAQATKQQEADVINLTKKIQQHWEAVLDPVSSAFGDAIKNMIKGTQSFSTAIRSMTGNILLSFVDLTVNAVKKWVAMEMAKTAASEIAAGTRVAVEKSADEESVMSSAAAALKQIAHSAAAAMANVYKSVSAIPYVGWLMAPVAALAAGAAVMAFGSGITSSEGGLWQVPSDRLAMIHKDETVLPANIASGLRAMVEGGGTSNHNAGPHFTFAPTIQAMDSRDVKKFFDRNGRAMAKTMFTQGTRFNPNLRPA